MPKITLPYDPSLTPDRLREIIKASLGPDYRVEKEPTPLYQWIVFQNPALGAAVRVKHKEQKQQTVVQTAGIVASLPLRILFALLALLPLIVLNLVSHSTVAKEVHQALENNPQLRGGQGAAGQIPAQAPPPPA
jgi:hypothetical protein